MAYTLKNSTHFTPVEHWRFAMEQYLNSLTREQLNQALDNIAATGKPS